MTLKHHEQSAEPRYDAGTLQKVTALAQQLQTKRQETLTVRDMEAIGAEVGLDPAFIHEALEQLTPARPAGELDAARLAEFRALLTGYSIPLLWGTIAFFSSLGNSAALITFFTLVAPLPLAALTGFLAGRRGMAFWSGVTLVAALAPTLARLMLGGDDRPGEEMAILAPYLLFGGPLAGLIGWQGAKVREHYFPLPSSKAKLPVSRPALIKLLFALQTQLEAQKQRRAFLSVDVVGSSEMKQSGPDLAVEHSFGQFRQWVEETVRRHRGQVQSAAGDGMMAAFESDGDALRAARDLQDGMDAFNAQHNRLPTPFRIRCGVSAGEVAVEEGAPIGHLQSPVLDRAAALQKRAEPGDILVGGELAGAAFAELGRLVSLPEPVHGEAAFSWRAGAE
jgi:class 3 adenylate cyclase